MRAEAMIGQTPGSPHSASAPAEVPSRGEAPTVPLLPSARAEVRCTPTAAPPAGAPGWLLYEDELEPQVAVMPLTQPCTRIGRSLSADVRFDDATVSRRHALVVLDAEGAYVLDDRSLNGVFVNGRRVGRARLRDGDEIRIGRHRLHYATREESCAPAVPPLAA